MALRQDLHGLAGPYALDALDSAAEQSRFERHLNRCDDCTSDVRGFRETATRLGFAAAQQPPPEMRDRVMAAVARTRQVPVSEEGARHARQGRSRPARLRPLTGLAMAGAALAAAAAIVLAVVLVNTQNQLTQARHQLTQAQTQLAAITAVQTATDAKVITKRTAIGGIVTVTSSASRRQLVLRTSGLPKLAPGKIYQLWLIGLKPNLTRAEGVLAKPQNGRTGPVLISGVLAGDTFGVTVEPAGGTIQPTTHPIVGIVLPS
jgi:anti-sigma-K factor RskA